MEEGAYTIRLSNKAGKDYKRYQRSQHFEDIENALEDIAKSPHSGTRITKLTNHAGDYRYRIGDMRIVYCVNDEIIEVEIIAIDSRGQVYK